MDSMEPPLDTPLKTSYKNSYNNIPFQYPLAAKLYPKDGIKGGSEFLLMKDQTDEGPARFV